MNFQISMEAFRLPRMSSCDDIACARRRHHFGVRSQSPRLCSKAHCEGWADTVGVSVVTAAKLRYGCAKKKSRKPAAQIEVILSNLTILALDVPQTPNMAGFARNLRLLARQLGQTVF